MTQKDAYIDAYKPEGWKDKSIHEKASFLANQNDKIKSRIDQLLDEKSSVALEKATSALDILKENQEKFAGCIVEATDAELDHIAAPDHKTRVKASDVALKYLAEHEPKKSVNLNIILTRDDVEEMLDQLDDSQDKQRVSSQEREGEEVIEVLQQHQRGPEALGAD